MKSFDASAGSPTKKYVVMVDLNTMGVGVEVAAFETGVVDVAAGCAYTTNACGAGEPCAHTATNTIRAMAAKKVTMMDSAFMVGHSSNPRRI